MANTKEYNAEDTKATIIPLELRIDDVNTMAQFVFTVPPKDKSVIGDIELFGVEGVPAKMVFISRKDIGELKWAMVTKGQEEFSRVKKTKPEEKTFSLLTLKLPKSLKITEMDGKVALTPLMDNDGNILAVRHCTRFKCPKEEGLAVIVGGSLIKEKKLPGKFGAKQNNFGAGNPGINF